MNPAQAGADAAGGGGGMSQDDDATVERVARAIVIANKRDPDQTIYKRNGPDDFEPVGCEWQRHEHEARAAITAYLSALPERELLAEALEALEYIALITNRAPAISHEREIHNSARAAADKIRAALEHQP